jgi:hypothetical protein
MPSSYTFSNGQTLTSSALTPDAMNKVLQALLMSVLGIDPATDSLAYSKVRVAWVAQPAPARGDDICAIRATEQDGPYCKIRDRKYSVNDASSTLQTDTWTRLWEVLFSFYGPNAFEHARLFKSALTFRFTHDALLASALTAITGFAATTRAPDLRDGQWWERSDFKLQLYELVTETLVINNITSIEIRVYEETGLVADITAQAP